MWTGRAIGELVALPFVVLRDLFRLVLWLICEARR
jgi:hypothetical protein